LMSLLKIISNMHCKYFCNPVSLGKLVLISYLYDIG
jgi:hypothetical protein